MTTSALCAFGCPRAFSSDGGIRHPGSSFIPGTGGWKQKQDFKEEALSPRKGMFLAASCKRQNRRLCLLLSHP